MKILFFQCFQILCLLFAVMFSRRLRGEGIGLFIPLLIIINSTEIIGVNYKVIGWQNNYALYNIFYLNLSTFLMLLLYYKMLEMNKQMQRVFKGICILMALFLTINLWFIQGINSFNTYSLIIIELANIILSSIVLFQLVFGADVIKNLFKTPYFWINAGTLFFSLGTLVLFGLQRYIIENNISLNHKSLYYALSPFLNIVLYSAWAYGFLLCQTAKSS